METIRPTKYEDIPRIMDIIAMASAYMERHGIDQWNKGYPDRSQFLADIERRESYVCEQEGRVVGTAALSLRNEPNYDRIYEGHWRTPGPYGVIHRIAVDERIKGSGVAGAFVDYIEKMCMDHEIFAVRVDTHKDNASMRRFLEKHGFAFCGVIYLADGDPRVAYEKILREDETDGADSRQL